MKEIKAMIDKSKKPLITVVVPIYNVEKYLDECVQSILNQSYKNLEIILVDDGSPDRCGKMCDDYATKDSRVKVIHQENGGLSAARNAAFQIATGSYITFVDSDDYISADMVETLYFGMADNEAEMAVVGFESFFEDGTTASSHHEKNVFTYTKTEALDNFFFNDYLTPCVCGKLNARRLWDTVRCPEGKLFEDQFTTYKLIDQCTKVVFITEPKYHYRKRTGSIGHSSFSKRTYDLYDAIHEEYEFISKKYPGQCSNITVARITWEIVFVNMMIAARRTDATVIKATQRFARQNKRQVWKCKYISGIRKFQIGLFMYSLPVYRLSYIVYKKKHPIG